MTAAGCQKPPADLAASGRRARAIPLSNAPKGNGIGATGSKNWVWFSEPFALVLRTLCPRF